MVTSRIPMRGRKFARRTNRARRATRAFNTALNKLPVASRFTNERSLRRRVMRPLGHLSKTQQTVALSVAAGTAFIMLDALVAGIVLSYTRRHKASQENQAAAEPNRGEEKLDGILVETVVEEFAGTARGQ